MRRTRRTLGGDQGEPDSLPRLLSALCNRSSDALAWVRLMYAYPGHVSDGLIEVMASQEKIVPYLDMPLQHGDPRTLRRMAAALAAGDGLRSCGKAARGDAGHRIAYDFHCRLPRRDRRGVPGTVEVRAGDGVRQSGRISIQSGAGERRLRRLPDAVPEEEKEERYGRLMEVQQPISLRKNQAQVGKVLDILVEGQGEIAESGAPLLMGRSYRDAPEVDGLVLVPGIADAAGRYDSAGAHQRRAGV